MLLMPSTSGLIRCLVILRVCPSMKHHMNSKQRRNANNKDSMKKQQNVRSYSIHHHILVFHPFSNLVKHMVRCGLVLTKPCMALNHQFLQGQVITMEKLEEPLLEAPTDTPRVEIPVEDIVILTVQVKVAEQVMEMPPTHSKDVARPMVQVVHVVVGLVVMEGVRRIISKVVLMVVQVLAEVLT